jgi:drug/metabolite transporter (DMT)-like permease
VTPTTDERHALGAITGLASAALFGISAPGAKLLLPAISPWLLAGVLYLGAGIGLSVVRLLKHLIASSDDENNLRREDLGRLFIIVIAGGALGPTLMLIGLTRVPGVVGSLLLNLEAVFTMLIAVLVFRERLGTYETLGAILVVTGAIVVSYQPATWQFDLVGALAIAGACFCWAIDNNLTRTISFRNPVQIVQIKTLGAGMGNVALAFVAGSRGRFSILPAALSLGFLCYGLSILLFVYALRYIGAARQAAFFAVAPFIGAVAAVPLLHERLTNVDLSGGALMALGLVCIVKGWS